MQHYEIMLWINPEHNDLIASTNEKCTQLIQNNKGLIHRFQEIEYTFDSHQSAKKSSYVLMNIECDQSTSRTLEENFRLNDAIKRHLIIRKNQAITEPAIFSRPKVKETATRSFKRKPITADQSSKESHKTSDPT